MEANGFLLNKPDGLTQTITVFRDGEFFTYYRHSMPCLGGWVKYRDSHGEKYFMNPYFPRDIYVMFPEGDITFIGYHRPGTKDIFKNNSYNEFIFSEESPWVSAFGSKDTIVFDDNYFVLTNMDTDPTVFYSLMRLGGLASGYYAGYGGNKNDWNPKASILFSKTGYADPRRLAGQKPIRTSGGTWAQGFGYTRPYNESIFKTKLPCEFKDFGKLPKNGYPPSFNFTNEYFIKTMKKEFGITIPVADPYNKKAELDKKAQDALVESWDYFKEKAKELGND